MGLMRLARWAGITIGSTTILPNDPTVSYTSAPCNGNNNGVGWLLCNGDMISSTNASGPSIAVNAYGSPDYNVYPHMQLWVNGTLVGEWDVTGTAQTYAANVPGAGLHYYHADHLGSARLETDANGAVVANCTYLPFGQEWSCSPSDPANHYKFTGHERDVESGLDHTWFRQYSSAQGRWLSPDLLDGDVVDPQTLNLYAYVRNNPLKLVDRLGLADGCTLDGLDIDCGTAGGLVAKGAVAPCPKSDCFLVTLRGGDFYRFVPEQTNYRDVPQGGTEVILTEAHWELVPGDQARFGPVLAMAGAIAAMDSPAPGPSDAVAAGYLVVGTATVAILAQNTKHNREVMLGLLSRAAQHITQKIQPSPPDDPNRNHWKKEVKGWVDRAKNMLKRFKGTTREAFEEIIKQLEGHVQ